MITPLLKADERTWRFWFNFTDGERATLLITVGRGTLPKYDIFNTSGVTREIVKLHVEALNKWKRDCFMSVSRALRFSRVDRLRFFNELEDGFAARYPKIGPARRAASAQQRKKAAC
jgi:hypothetical protein